MHSPCGRTRPAAAAAVRAQRAVQPLAQQQFQREQAPSAAVLVPGQVWPCLHADQHLSCSFTHRRAGKRAGDAIAPAYASHRLFCCQSGVKRRHLALVPEYAQTSQQKPHILLLVGSLTAHISRLKRTTGMHYRYALQVCVEAVAAGSRDAPCPAPKLGANRCARLELWG